MWGRERQQGVRTNDVMIGRRAEAEGILPIGRSGTERDPVVLSGTSAPVGRQVVQFGKVGVSSVDRCVERRAWGSTMPPPRPPLHLDFLCKWGCKVGAVARCSAHVDWSQGRTIQNTVLYVLYK